LHRSRDSPAGGRGFLPSPSTGASQSPAPATTPTDKMDWEPTRANAQRAKWVSKEEINKRKAEGQCLRCGKSGHRIAFCPYKPAINPNGQPTRASKANGGNQVSSESNDDSD